MCENYEKDRLTEKIFDAYMQMIIEQLKDIQEQVGGNKDLEKLIERMEETLAI